MLLKVSQSEPNRTRGSAPNPDQEWEHLKYKRGVLTKEEHGEKEGRVRTKDGIGSPQTTRQAMLTWSVRS